MGKFEDLVAWLDSEDCKKAVDEFVERENKIYDVVTRWCEKLRNKSLDEKRALLAKVDKKYMSDEYRRRWYKRNIEPVEELYWFAYEYARRYGVAIECYDMFASECYAVDGEFVVTRYDGQGSFIKVEIMDDARRKIASETDERKRIALKYVDRCLAMIADKYDGGVGRDELSDILYDNIVSAVYDATNQG